MNRVLHAMMMYLKKFSLAVVCIIFTSSIIFAGDIPESLMTGDQKALFIGTLVSRNSESCTIRPSTVMMGSVDEEQIKVNMFEKYYGTEDLPAAGDIVVVVLEDEETINNMWIFKATSDDYKTLKLVSEKHNMVKSYQKYINEGRYFEAQKRIEEEAKAMNEEGASSTVESQVPVADEQENVPTPNKAISIPKIAFIVVTGVITVVVIVKKLR